MEIGSRGFTNAVVPLLFAGSSRLEPLARPDPIAPHGLHGGEQSDCRAKPPGCAGHKTSPAGSGARPIAPQAPQGTFEHHDEKQGGRAPHLPRLRWAKGIGLAIIATATNHGQPSLETGPDERAR